MNLGAFEEFCSANDQFVCILHISDLHFTAKTSLGEGWPLHFRARLSEALAGGKCDLVIATGDIVDNSEFSKAQHQTSLTTALSFLSELCKSNCPNGDNSLILVPGNHDYRWFGISSSEKAKRDFKNTFNKYFRHRLINFKNVHIPLLIACFDSIFNKQDSARGFVNPDELARFTTELSKIQSPENLLRIALIHHHPLPVARAESQELRSIIDKLVGTRVIGADEYMLLRNSGTFIHSLLANDFRMVLHGHLHERGYWRALAKTYQEVEKWIEVVSGASIGKHDTAKRHNFNLIKIYTDGYIEGQQYGWSNQGQVEAPITIPFMSYDVTRQMRPPPAQSLIKEFKEEETSGQTEKNIQIWDIYFKNGDYLSTEIHRGLRANDKPLSKIIAATLTTGLTTATFSARKLSGKSNVSVLPPLYESTDDGKGHVEFPIVFTEPLTASTPIDILYSYTYRGVLYKNKEDQHLMKETEDLGWDGISQQIRRSTKQLVIRLRFHPDEATNWTPEELVLDVYDEYGMVCNREKCSSHVFFDYNNFQAIAHVSTNLCSEAILVVDRPPLLYKYELKWSLPDELESPDRVTAKKLQRAFYANLEGDLNRRDRANQIVKELFNSCSECLSVNYQVKLSNKHDIGYLFAYDEAQAKLLCRATTGSLRSDELGQAIIAYGMDVVGTSFRRREPVVFSKSDRRVTLFRHIPAAYQFILAIPLHHPDLKSVPIAVFALASKLDTSALHMLTNREEAVLKLNASVLPKWEANCIAACES